MVISTFILEQKQGLSPTEVFLARTREMGDIKNIDEYFAVANKYASQAARESLAGPTAASAKAPAAEKIQASTFVKAMMFPADRLQVVKEEIHGETAVLTLQDKTDSTNTGTATMKLEVGVWKLDKYTNPMQTTDLSK